MLAEVVEAALVEEAVESPEAVVDRVLGRVDRRADVGVEQHVLVGTADETKHQRREEEHPAPRG
ncbi:MAG: hypothetical protein FJ090_12040 [Deltaproteobacteria bacterium]|nr:hypothetical protein [Deltaproteobacteria bacterium]